MRGQPYTPCKLYYDGWQEIEVGDFLKTPAGSAYLIQSIRQNKNKPYRRHLECLRWPVDEIPEGATVHPLHWYKRTKKRGKRVADLQATHT